METVLITGGAGYIGSVLSRLLLEKGYAVKCLDRLFFGKESIEELFGNPQYELIKDDIRWFEPDVLDDVDAVIDMAALSNDPSGELNPEKTMEINYKGRERMARLAKEHGVSRYVLASSCSIYGFQEGVLTEESTINPLTTYAEANGLAEQAALPLSDEHFSVTVLRQATVFGLSPRMRFDLAINGMTLGFYQNGKIPVMRDGTQWRPFIHVRDTSKAFIKVIESDVEKVNGETFNVGDNDQNIQILPLAKMVAKGAGVSFEFDWYGDPDHRSYQVSFDKIHNILGYETSVSVEDGAREIANALNNGKVVPSKKMKTVEWYKYLIESQQILDDVMMEGVVL
jgi:nucleoside-diphosphate-sugar epimerase